jgi:hypothetical protein
MKYDWEKKITKSMLARIQKILPAGFTLRGVAVECDESVEGAMVRNRLASTGDMRAVDAWQDIRYDVEALFLNNTAIVFPAGSEAIAAQFGVDMTKRDNGEPQP